MSRGSLEQLRSVGVRSWLVSSLCLPAFVNHPHVFVAVMVRITVGRSRALSCKAPKMLLVIEESVGRGETWRWARPYSSRVSVGAGDCREAGSLGLA